MCEGKAAILPLAHLAHAALGSTPYQGMIASDNPSTHTMHIAIVGAGLAGLCAAHYLRQGGAEVSVFDRNHEVGVQTSWRNGSLLHPSMVEPWNQPGVLGLLWRNLGNPEAAMLLRPHALPGLLGWGLRFIRESSPERFRANTLANLALARHSQALMHELQGQGIDYLGYRRGSLVLLRSAQAMAEARSWREWLAPHGVPFAMLSVDQLVALEPALAPVAGQLVGATHQTDDEGADPKRFNDSMAESLLRRGVRLCLGQAVERITLRDGRTSGLRFADGSEQPFDAVVLAAAAWSTELARSVGLRLPVRPVKGYSLTLPRFGMNGADLGPRVPIGDAEMHVAVVPVGDDRVRVAGTAEFTGMDLTLAPERVANLQRLVTRLYPRYMASLPADAAQAWTGLRPVSPDGVALIGSTRVPGLFLNTGQGHTGWTVAAASGQLLASAVLHTPAALDARPYAPQRFAGC